MKFAKYLESESIPEWRKAYINYKGLKKRLKAIEKLRKLNQIEESIQFADHSFQRRHDLPLPDSLPRSQPRIPRQRSSILDDRSRSIAQGTQLNLFQRLSSRFRKQETELDKLRNRSFVSSTIESQPATVLEEALQHANEPEQYFFVMLDQDLETISRFYDEKETEAKAKYEALEMQVQLIHNFATHLTQMDSHDIEGLNPIHWFRRRGSSDSNTVSDHVLPPSVKYNGDHHVSYSVARSRLKKAITEYYRSLELLKSYKILNATGFQKILKKFDKTAGWKASHLYMQKVNQYHWMQTGELDKLLHSTEKLYIDEFADGHRSKGMAKLRIPEREEHYTPTTWRIGFYIGLSLALLARVAELALNPDTRNSMPNFEYNLQIYACFSLPILFCLGFSVNTLVWTRSRINYKFIFEFDPRDNLNYHEFAELPSLLLLIQSWVMYIDFSKTFSPTVPSELCPLLLFVVMVAIMTCPFPILYYSSRRWLGYSLGRILLSYSFPIEFRDFFIADELNSLAYSFWTFSYFVCAYHWHWDDLASRCPVKIFWYTPFLACLPPWWRLLQCLRRYRDSHEKVHLVNALKYSTSIGSTLATGLRRMYPNASMETIWLLFCVVNSTYTSIWDIKMDWGLLQHGSQHVLLRDDIVFYRWTYYVAMPINILLRFAWTLNAASLGLQGEAISFMTAFLEAYRRIQWNFFRMENEHINNCGNFRAIKEIPLPFAFRDMKSQANLVEEGGIQLPVESHENPVIPPVAILPSKELVTPVGSFYGRRDFENRHDLEDDVSDSLNNLKRQPSLVGAVLERITSTRKDVDSSDEEDESE